MNAPATLPPNEDVDTLMLKLARNIAMDMHPLEDILTYLGISVRQFDQWREHPRFLMYLRTEREAWESATNTHERTKLKAATIMEQFMLQAHTELADRKTPLNQRVELGKLISKIAGMGEPKVVNGGEGGFRLQINIGNHSVAIAPQAVQKVINHDDMQTIEAVDETGHNLLDSVYTIED